MRAVVFPGQGSQTVGMGADLAGEPVVRATYDEAAATLGYDVAAVSFAGPSDELARTDVTQPALLVNSVALLRLLHEDGFGFDVAFGHSLGEYSALVATGAVEFAVAVALVRRRGVAMAAAAARHPGGMAAVLGLADGAVESLCSEIGDLWPANYNCPGQVVVSGKAPALEALAQRAPAAGAKRVVPLAVSGAFHSPLVEEACQAMKAPLEAVAWNAPAPEFFSVCSLRAERDGFAGLLQGQITAPVRFAQAVRALRERGCDEFIEVGPGNVLCGLIRRIAPEVRVTPVSDRETLAVLRRSAS
jgi:[acyl-carrier-protein] S-malonyltransferase